MTQTTKQSRSEEIDSLMKMAHSPVRNYVIPGLMSWLIGQPGKMGCVRLFECTRQHEEPVTPHSHRFDFLCRVLRGRVRNVIWERADHRNMDGADLYQASKLIYGGEPGKYDRIEKFEQRRFTRVEREYEAGDTYKMAAEQIHSIFFDRGTVVQFFEGPTRRNDSLILEPVVDGEVIPTFKAEPWMFKREWQV